MANIKNDFEITIQKDDLAVTLGTANSILERTNIDPYFTNIKISTVDNNLLEICSTDGELYLAQKIGVVIEVTGEIIVPGKMLAEIVTKIADETIRLTKKAGKNTPLIITGKTCCFELNCVEDKQYPQIYKMESKGELVISCESLATIIKHVQFSVSSDETRYSLSGVYLHNDKEQLVSAATDGHRLAVSSEIIERMNIKEDFGFILPKKALRSIDSKILTNKKIKSTSLKITLSDTLVKFSNEYFTLISKLVDGNFPDYAKLIPKDMSRKLVINRNLLQGAISRAAIFTNERCKAVKFIIDDKKLQITASEDGIGRAEENINYSTKKEEFCSFEGENTMVGLNYIYIIDVLKVLNSEKITIYFAEDQAPILLKLDERPQDNFVIMPLKI